MPRKKAAVKESELHDNAPWAGYVNMHLTKEHSDRLEKMVETLHLDRCLEELINEYYKVSVSYDIKRGYRAMAIGCMGSKNAGKAFTGYSGSSVENAIFSLYYRLAMILEFETYQETQLGMDFG